MGWPLVGWGITAVVAIITGRGCMNATTAKEFEHLINEFNFLRKILGNNDLVEYINRLNLNSSDFPPANDKELGLLPSERERYEAAVELAMLQIDTRDRKYIHNDRKYSGYELLRVELKGLKASEKKRIEPMSRRRRMAYQKELDEARAARMAPVYIVEPAKEEDKIIEADVKAKITIWTMPKEEIKEIGVNAIPIKEFFKEKKPLAMLENKTKAIEKMETLPVEPKTYTVKSGDTVWEICQRFGCDVEKTIERNGIKTSGDIAWIYPEQVLILCN